MTPTKASSHRAGRFAALLASSIFVGVFAAVLVGQPSEAWAQTGPAACEVYEIKAHNGAGGIAPELSKVQKQLSRPPFTSWKSFALVKLHRPKLELMKPVVLPLKSGGKMTMLYRDRKANEGKKVRLRLSLTLDDRNGKRIFDVTTAADSGDVLLIGAQPVPGEPGSTYVVGYGCTAS